MNGSARRKRCWLISLGMGRSIHAVFPIEHFFSSLRRGNEKDSGSVAWRRVGRGEFRGRGSEKCPNQPVCLIVPFPPRGPSCQRHRRNPAATVFVARSNGLGEAAAAWAWVWAGSPGPTAIRSLWRVRQPRSNLAGVGNYDPIKDFAPVLLVASAPQVLIAAKDSQFKTTAIWIEAAKSKPGSRNLLRRASERARIWPVSWMQQLSGAIFCRLCCLYRSFL